MKCDVCSDECYDGEATNITMTAQKNGKVVNHVRRNMCRYCTAAASVFFSNGPIKVVSDGVKQERGVIEYMQAEGEKCMKATKSSETVGSNTTE